MNKKTIFGLCAAGLLFVSGVTLSGCGTSSGPGLLTQETPLSRSDFLLNTFVTITLYDSDDSSILDDSMALCKEYENIFSKTLETSEHCHGLRRHGSASGKRSGILREI